jgi:hypothetical protein
MGARPGKERGLPASSRLRFLDCAGAWHTQTHMQDLSLCFMLYQVRVQKLEPDPLVWPVIHWSEC